MDFWRGEAYSTFFEYLDSTGGFYYEAGGPFPYFKWFTDTLSCQITQILPRQHHPGINSVGEMHPYILLAPLSSFPDQEYTFGMKLVMNTIRIRIVRGWEIIGKRENVHVILNEVLVRFSYPVCSESYINNRSVSIW